jgi:hypothetical protein
MVLCLLSSVQSRDLVRMSRSSALPPIQFTAVCIWFLFFFLFYSILLISTNLAFIFFDFTWSSRRSKILIDLYVVVVLVHWEWSFLPAFSSLRMIHCSDLDGLNIKKNRSNSVWISLYFNCAVLYTSIHVMYLIGDWGVILERWFLLIANQITNTHDGLLFGMVS